MKIVYVLCELLILFVWPSVGHLCMWQPMQRGNFSLVTFGSHDCYRKIAPCGGFNSSTSKQRTIIKAGSTYRIEFQQEVNHYYPVNPGRLDISFALGLDPNEEDFHELNSFNDYNPMNHNTQTNFSIEVQLPNIECEQCVLRVRYLTNNPTEEDEGTTFHQCSDIQLVNHSNSIEEKRIFSKVEGKMDRHDCCAPSSFEMSFIHSIPDVELTSSGRIYYDKTRQQMRLSMNSQGIEYNMWMNFTSGKQYLENINERSCRLIGLNLWNDWCYGNTFNQSEDFIQSGTSCLNGKYDYCNRWQNGDFIFEATQFECFPSSLTRLSTDEKTFYFNFKNESIPIEIFQPDPICLQ